MFKPYGYIVNIGYFGLLKDGTFRLFATENEYLEHIEEELNNARKKTVS